MTRRMKVLVGCEFSGVVRDAFLAHDQVAISADLLPSESPGPHYQGNVLDILRAEAWDLLIAHPPCTYLCKSGVRWLYKEGHKGNGADRERCVKLKEAIVFYNALKSADIPRIAIENSVMHRYAKAYCGEPDQIVQPWMFGHGEIKAISLQLKGLPKLQATHIVAGRHPRVHLMPRTRTRWKERSRFLPGVAHAMASQWTANFYHGTPSL